MFVFARLVHGDLSEYNMLLQVGAPVAVADTDDKPKEKEKDFNKETLFVIDVGQSVEHDHPHAMNFLRRDIANVTKFFRSKGLAAIMSYSELFDFVTTPECPFPGMNTADEASWTPASQEQAFLHLKEQSLVTWSKRELDISESDEQVFLQIHVPRTLQEVKESKAYDTHDAKAEEKQFVTAMLAAGAGLGESDALKADDSDSATADEESSEEGDALEPGMVAEGGPTGKGGPCLADMTKDERKAHRKAVKSEKAEKRKEKLPKHKKKKACNAHKKK